MTASSSGDSFLEVADCIGRRLCRDALWADGRCNWLGWSLERNGSYWTPAFRAQSMTIYDGTAGIALFLSWLVRFTGDSLERATLAGALNRLERALTDRAPAPSPGFYHGAAGVAAVYVTAGEALGDEALIERGLVLLAGSSGVAPDGAELDVLSGSAGAIPILLQLADRFRRPELIEAAAAHGERLLRSATRGDDGWSWYASGEDGRDRPIGYTRGAGGIACALLELHRATGEDAYREAALEGLRHERSRYDAVLRDWPDLRVPGGAQEQPAGAHPRYPTAWCHGAPDVGFARLRACQLLNGENPVDGLAEELAAAVQITADALRQPVAHGQGFCLCHGAAGRADLLLEAAGVLAQPQLREAAEAVGRFGIAQYHQTNVPWPCGVPTRGEAPNLMLGLAGIGYFYLRLHAPETVPSVLAPTPTGRSTREGRAPQAFELRQGEEVRLS